MIDLTNYIEGIELFTTRSCNMRCTYCYENKEKNTVFSSETSKNLLELIRNNHNIKYIDLFGGESLLPDIADNIMDFLQELAKIRTNITFYIVTNGYETDKILNILDYIKDTFEEVTIQISMDGSKNAHDMCRLDLNKNGTFDKVFNNTILLLERYKEASNVKIYIHHVISIENIQYIIETVCLDNKLCMMYPDLRIAYNSEHSIHTNAHNLEFIIEILEFLHNLYLNNDLKPYVWDQFIHAYDYFQTEHSGCDLMNKYITVDTNGDIIPCHFFNKSHNHSYYNINTKEFNQDNYNKSLEFIKHKEPQSELRYDCKSCVSKGFCPFCSAASYLYDKDNKNNIVGSTACSYAHTIGNWVINKYNNGITKALKDEEKQHLLDHLNGIADELDKDFNAETLKEFLFYRIKCKINGIYDL